MHLSLEYAPVAALHMARKDHAGMLADVGRRWSCMGWAMGILYALVEMGGTRACRSVFHVHENIS